MKYSYFFKILVPIVLFAGNSIIGMDNKQPKKRKQTSKAAVQKKAKNSATKQLAFADLEPDVKRIILSYLMSDGSLNKKGKKIPQGKTPHECIANVTKNLIAWMKTCKNFKSFYDPQEVKLIEDIANLYAPISELASLEVRPFDNKQEGYDTGKSHNEKIANYFSTRLYIASLLGTKSAKQYIKILREAPIYKNLSPGDERYLNSIPAFNALESALENKQSLAAQRLLNSHNLCSPYGLENSYKNYTYWMDLHWHLIDLAIKNEDTKVFEKMITIPTLLVLGVVKSKINSINRVPDPNAEKIRQDYDYCKFVIPYLPAESVNECLFHALYFLKIPCIKLLLAHPLVNVDATNYKDETTDQIISKYIENPYFLDKKSKALEVKQLLEDHRKKKFENWLDETLKEN